MLAEVPNDERVAVVLLAGGSGSRMKANMPKQFLELNGRPVLQHSLELLAKVQQLEALVLVINEEYRDLPFLTEAMAADPRIKFADPGSERQDSVCNGLGQVPDQCTLVTIHDSARPLVLLDDVHKCLCDASEHGAAVLAVPMKATVKESEDGQFVAQTLVRSKLWEIQTPQVLRPAVLREGFRLVAENGWEVTDDVSIVERMGKPVKLTMGDYENFKLTTPEDMVVAAQIMAGRAA